MGTGTEKSIKRNFIFTSSGFVPDVPAHSDEEEQMRRQGWYDRGGITALYRMGLTADLGETTPSEAFLLQVSSAFFRKLTDLPELELARENAETELDALFGVL